MIGLIRRLFFKKISKETFHLHQSKNNIDKEVNRFYYEKNNEKNNGKNNEKPVIHIHYNLRTGEIRSFQIREEYRNKTLGSQILYEVIDEMKENNCFRTYCISHGNHPFWKKHKFIRGLEWNDDNDTVVFYKPL
jgi:N-acetylglutamate synthase-like GNAT family acetyltransferase